jgi:hypothetical protein
VLSFLLSCTGYGFEVAAWPDLEKRLPVEVAVFEELKGGVLGVLVSETFDGDHPSDLLLLRREALVAVDSYDLTEAKIPHVFYALFFRH